MTSQPTRILRLELALEQSALFRRVSSDAEELWCWQNYDLASLVENWFDVVLEPARIDDRAREHWGAKVTTGERASGRAHVMTWMLHGGRRIGTLCFSPGPGRLLTLSSLFVVADERRRGHARRALEAARAIAVQTGLDGLHLTTEWSWPRAIACYLTLGFWVRGHTRRLHFVFGRGLPDWELARSGRERWFCVGPPGERTRWIRACPGSHGLDWQELEPMRSVAPSLRCAATNTFALALAMEGTPLEQARPAGAIAGAARRNRGPGALFAKLLESERRANERGFPARERLFER